MFSLKYKLINFFTHKQHEQQKQHRNIDKKRSKSVFDVNSALKSSSSSNRYRAISSGELENGKVIVKKNNNQYERILQKIERININDLSLNEFRSLISNKLKDKFIENVKLNELLKLLPLSVYVDEEENEGHCWCYDLTIAEIKSLLWMDDYELYPLKMGEIKVILNELKPISNNMKNSDSKNNLLNTSTISSTTLNSPNSISSSTMLKSGQYLCKICLELNADCVFIDCGHLVSCNNCSKTLNYCPICKKDIINFIKAY